MPNVAADQARDGQSPATARRIRHGGDLMHPLEEYRDAPLWRAVANALAGEPAQQLHEATNAGRRAILRR